MPIIRRDKRPDGFYILDRKVAEDSRLSWEARGLLMYLLVKPDHWQISIANLIGQTKAGRDKVYGILRELGQVGYLRKAQERGSGKFVKHYYLIFDAPPLTEKPEMVQPLPALPDLAEPDTANPTLVNNQDPASTKDQSKRAARPRDVLFDALVEVCGLDPAKMTKNERGKLNKAVGMARDVEATRDQILTNAVAYRKKFGSDCELTPLGLMNNWAQTMSTPRKITPPKTAAAEARENESLDAYLKRGKAVGIEINAGEEFASFARRVRQAEAKARPSLKELVKEARRREATH